MSPTCDETRPGDGAHCDLLVGHIGKHGHWSISRLAYEYWSDEPEGST